MLAGIKGTGAKQVFAPQRYYSHILIPQEYFWVVDRGAN
jgi:hypothetical protein